MYTSIKSFLAQKGPVRLLESHDQFSTELIRDTVGESGQSFQGVWISGLTQTTHLGIPDTEIISPLRRAILEAGSIKLHTKHDRSLCAAFDADSGGDVADIPALVAVLTTIGVSMVIVEDKTLEEPGKKVNSLLKAIGSQDQADPHEFAKVIQAFRSATLGRELLVTARIESFNVRIAKDDAAEEEASVQSSLQDALARAAVYTEAGADAIMIHSKSSSPFEVLAFLERFRDRDPITPLVVVPTTYSSTTRASLVDAGANIIIYANHLMRAKIRAVQNVSDHLLAIIPGLFANNENARASLKARNYAYLLRTLLERDYWGDEKDEEARQYLVIAHKRAIENMRAAVEELAFGEKSGCEADERIIPVKTLLQINALQLATV
ncbi:catabolic 3-dehydroquinase [Penicillium atrosanguineum]|uniref:catabolic 3-dehydroquinase n=1 Tax=Penicillium atrosanguineum TaxID=1132637 RepID=UPI0023842986|nr:catabolic 3-dehydroquinase [Penicillium atrosanguineum]KAJ5293170.1 catabolic 3-dehydroquinase [Penicillium atrosanguineum]